MKRIIFGCIFIVLSAVLMSCERQQSANVSTNGAGGDSPTDAYKKLYAAVKAKDSQAIEAVMTNATIEFAKANAARTHQTLEQMIANGFTATTFSPNLPQIRDERINGDMGAVEVFNSKDNRWEDLPFIREGSTWKLAIGEMWAGKFKSPGKGRAQLDAEAANAMSNNMIPLNANVNGNFRSGNVNASNRPPIVN
jgi:hypothetical protein